MGRSEMEDFTQDLPPIRLVAVQVSGDPSLLAGAGADRAWVGVRGCAELFLALCADGTIRRWLIDARQVGKRVGLCSPVIVPATLQDDVVDAIKGLASLADRVMTGDLGVASRVCDRIPVSWCGNVRNSEHARFLRSTGIEGVRMVTPVSDGCRDINRIVDLEVPAFGRIPLAFMPECVFRAIDRSFDCPGACISATARDAGQFSIRAVTDNDASAQGIWPRSLISSLFDVTPQSLLSALSNATPQSVVAALSSVAQPIRPRPGTGLASVIVRPCFIESGDFLDMSPVMKPFGRDTCAVVESSGLDADEVRVAVDALREGDLVTTSRPLFVTEQDELPLPSTY